MGSFCSAIIVCRMFALPDPRLEGSKNPGATNVLRIAGKQYAVLVMLGDLLKGTIPVLIAGACHAEPITVSFTVLGAVVGHMYPIFFDFKGGKGVATAIGALLGFHFMVGVMVAATWLLVANFSRFSSLASIVAITLSPLYTLLLTKNIYVFPPLFIMVILILFKHKNNITRLIDGTEPKIKFKTNVINEIIPPSPPATWTEAPMAKEEQPAFKKKVPAKTIKTPIAKTAKISKTKEPTKPEKTKISKTDTAEKTTKKAVKKPIKKTGSDKAKADKSKADKSRVSKNKKT